MNTQTQKIARVTGLVLAITVATQIAYIVISNMGLTPNRPVIWSIEVLAFTAISIGGLALLPARPLAGAAIATGGLLNVIQAGMGLVMFPPLTEGGEAMAPAFTAVLAFAFLLFHAGKIAFGVAAIALVGAAWHGLNGAMKGLAAIAGIAGLAAVVLNAAAIPPATDLTFPAGAAGTVVAALLALMLLMWRRFDIA